MTRPAPFLRAQPFIKSLGHPDPASLGNPAKAVTCRCCDARHSRSDRQTPTERLLHWGDMHPSQPPGFVPSLTASPLATHSPARFAQTPRRTASAVPSQALPVLSTESSDFDQLSVTACELLTGYSREARSHATLADASDDQLPPARPRPPKTTAKSSTIHRMSLAVRKALAPRSVYAAPSPFIRMSGRNLSAPDLVRPVVVSPPVGFFRPPSPPYTPRREARSLAASLMGPPLNHDHSVPRLPRVDLNSKSLGLIQPPVSRPAGSSRQSPTPEDFGRLARVRRQRQTDEIAEVEQRKRQSQWFTAQAASQPAYVTTDAAADREWIGLRRHDLLDVLVLPGDVARPSPTAVSDGPSLLTQDDVAPTSMQSTLRQTSTTPSLYSATSIFSDDESHHLATVVPSLTSPAAATASGSWERSRTLESASLTPPPLFRIPFPLEPSPRLSSMRLPSPQTAAAARPGRVGVHARIHSREELGRKMREIDWAGDEEGRRRTESLFLE